MTNQDSSMLHQVAAAVRASGRFSSIDCSASLLECQLQIEEAHVSYYIEMILAAADASSSTVFVGLRTPDRWISESIETDLLHTGDKMEELLEDELIDLGLEETLPIQHFRDDQKRYTFRSLVPNPTADRLQTILQAYIATFSQLGDLKPATD